MGVLGSGRGNNSVSALDNFGHSQYTYSTMGGLYMEKRTYSGRYFMLLGAVALAAWAG